MDRLTNHGAALGYINVDGRGAPRREDEGEDVFFLGGASLICPPINGRGPI